MVFESDLSPLFNIVTARDQSELEALERRAEREPSIERFESVLRFLPEDLPRTRRALDALADRCALAALPARSESATREQMAQSFFAAGRGAGPGCRGCVRRGVERPRRSARGGPNRGRGGRRTARAADDAQVRGWNEGQQRLLDRLRELLTLARDAVVADSPESNTLPDALRARFITRSGLPLGFLFPAGDVFEPRELEAYIEAVDGSRPRSPDSRWSSTRWLAGSRPGFAHAVVAGALLVPLILLIAFREPRDALLAMVPLVMGTVWMIGAMRWLDGPFNFANLVAVPLIIGVGIDNGVHVIHRVRLEGRGG